jgi:hypothetical protein
MVENIVPLSGNTSAGENMVLLGVDRCFHSVPLHRINSKLDFVSGQAVVGIRYMLPDEDSPLLFGIDYASDKAILDPIVFEEHSCEENELENTVVYHACAVTLAMKKPLEEEETLLEDGTIETSDVELKDTFVWLMSTITFYIAMSICVVILQTRTQILSKYR